MRRQALGAGVRGGHSASSAWQRLAAVAMLVAAAGAAHGQARPGVARVGMLSFFAAPASRTSDLVERGFQQGLRENGYEEGKNIVVERRFAAGRQDRLAAMAEELVRLRVDVILAGGQPAREAARKATATIPILTLSGSDPVREGWAQSLARPGGNVTGMTFTFPELGPKRLELLKEVAPTLSRVVVLVDPREVVDAVDVIRETEAGAERLGLHLQIIEVHGAADFDAAFVAARRQRAQALFPLAMWAHRERLAAMAAQAGLLSVGETSDEAGDGYLLGYGVDLADLVRRAVAQMDKILRGARAGDLPVERPTKFRLTVNLRTARALGVTLPQSLLLRADETIQ